MAATNQAVNISVDDGIPLDFLAEMHVAMDCLPVDEEEANRIIAEKLRREQQKRVRRFNNAWNVQPIEHEEAVSRPPPCTSAASTQIPLVESVRDPRIIARNTQALLESAIIQRQTYPSLGAMQRNKPSPLVDAVIQERAKAKRIHSSNQVNLDDSEEADDNDVVLEEEQQHTVVQQPRRVERSRVPPFRSAAAAALRPRETARSHLRGHRSRRHSRSPSRSPTHRRYKRHNRSRSRHRSRSRSRSSSPCSEHSHGTVDSRGRSSSRKNPAVDQTAMLQMMAMTMQQMFNQINGNQLPLPVPGNHVQYAAGAPVAAGIHGMADGAASQLTPSAFRNMFANTSTQAGRPEEVVDVISDMSTDPLENEESKQPKYDVSTELFLEGKLSFSDFLFIKPSTTRTDRIAPVDPKVPKRINEAITVLEQQGVKKQSARFMYVPPTFYDSDDKQQQQQVHNRSPLIWNNQNVLFQFTSNAKEVKQCQPFSNVNAKLKDLIAKLGLDEGIVSHQFEKVIHAAAANKNADTNNCSTVGSDVLSSRIHAITPLPPKPGSGKVRHLIDRSVQTDGHACMQCVARSKKTFISSFTQTTPPVKRLDAEVQTSGPPLSAPNIISLDGLNAQQIETVEAIVRFIRARQLGGSIESVQHALRNDRVVGTGGMTPAIQHNAQRLIAQVKSDLQRTDGLPGHSSGGSHGYYGNNYNSMPQAPNQPVQCYDTTPRDTRFRHPGSGITRTVRTTTTTMAEQIIPACYQSQPQLSKKTMKRLKRQQQQQYQQHW
ncbi:uncharacterized protein LOC126567194 [Anopheles maculipalpis]|uniref:uncharacterized protein LOC126567194 n=1 Tax=Anopheles maculipalpis TaxID=1496333 RepID=UPI0021590370|nr:uncharacterized protein LOC126567194 [Anopheles maculipalpis]